MDIELAEARARIAAQEKLLQDARATLARVREVIKTYRDVGLSAVQLAVIEQALNDA